MMDEGNQNLINMVFAALFQARSAFLPQEKVAQFNKEVADVFLKKAVKEQENVGLQTFCIEKAISFIIDEENLKLCSSWINEGKIKVGGEELKCEFTPEHKYSIIKSYCASKAFTLDEKNALKAKVFENDTSDKAKNVQEVCESILPDADLKAKIWEEVTNIDSQEGLMKMKIKMSGFFQREQQLDLIEPYFEKFY